MLVHPDGEPFAVWNPNGEPLAYCLFFTDEDMPPAPESLEIQHVGSAEIEGLRWIPAHVQTEELIVRRAIGPYDSETGEDL